MDALSDVLRVIRLTGGVYLEASFCAPWCVSSQVEASDYQPILKNASTIIGFHYVVSGRLQLQIEGEAPQEIGSNTIVLLPRNDPHALASGPGLRPVEAGQLIQAQREGALARIDQAGDGQPTRFVCGFVGSETRAHPLLDVLPRVLVMKLDHRPSADWIAGSFKHAAQEVASGQPGAGTILAKLSELLFVEALREYTESLPAERKGWLAALRDPAIGRALAAMHGRIAHPWTTEEIAAEALLSRSAFADRFSHLLGVPPMTYLATWRMQVAAQLLRETPKPISQIAAEVGYESEQTFTRAFKREMGTTPGQYRRNR